MLRMMSGQLSRTCNALSHTENMYKSKKSRNGHTLISEPMVGSWPSTGPYPGSRNIRHNQSPICRGVELSSEIDCANPRTTF